MSLSVELRWRLEEPWMAGTNPAVTGLSEYVFTCLCSSAEERLPPEEEVGGSIPSRDTER